MHLSKILIATSVCLIVRLAAAAPAPTVPETHLEAGPLTAKLAADGRVLSLAVRGHELLSGPGQLTLQVDQGEPVPLGSGLEGFKTGSTKGGFVIEGREPNSGVAVRAEWLAGKDLECRLTLTAGGPKRQGAAVELRLPCVKQTLQLLAPSGEDHVAVDFSRPVAVGYRGDARGLVMPAAVLYQPEQDWGLTAMADFALPTRGFELRIEDKPPAVAVRRVHLRLEPGKPVTVSIILFGHEGDWRPGLGHVLERYPEFFVVADPRVPRLHGAFVCSGGTPQDDTIAAWAKQHVRTVEVHGTLPFYGQHLPLGKEWPIFADDQWHRLKEKPDPEKPADDASWQMIHAYVARKSPGRISVAKINDYIRRLHARGIYALMYFNPTEAWRPWIVENYPEALYRNAAGKPQRAWYESYLVCPDPESRWGKHLLAEFQKMMDLYPQADGFFMDQSTYDSFDYAHDDGWSIRDGRTGYRLGWAIDQTSARCRKLAKARGKFLWWNGPYSSDIGYYAEGMMAEAGNEGQVRAIQYLTMGGRACCTLSRQGEVVFQNCAAYGLYPTAMSDAKLVRLADRYWPVFELFRGKRWVFEPHALRLPEGTKGNIFRLPDGNVLVTVVTAGRSVDGTAFDLDVPLEVRLSDAAEFHAAYFLSPDLLGKRRLALQRHDGAIRIVLPRHRSASAVLLAKTGVHAALDGPWELVAGGRADAALTIDNWTAEDVPFAVGLPGAKEETISVASGASVRRPFSIAAPPKRREMREKVGVHASVGGRPCGDYEFYVDDPLGVGLQLPEAALCQDRTAVVRVDVFNPGEARDVEVALTGDGLRVEPAVETARLGARAKRSLEFRLAAARGGKTTLRASARSGDDRAQAEQAVEVFATKAPPALLKRVRSGSLLLDVFGSDGGPYKDKPVLLNGVSIGVLSEPNPGVFTSCGWQYQEGKVFQLGKPLVGITVRIPPEKKSSGK